MKVVVWMTVVVTLHSNCLAAQDVHDSLTAQQSNTDVKKQEHQSEPEDKLFDSSVAENVDKNADETPSVESSQVEVLDIDVDKYLAELEGDGIDRDMESEILDSEELESEGKDTQPANQQELTEFPPAFDQSTIDSSQVAQVADIIMHVMSQKSRPLLF